MINIKQIFTKSFKRGALFAAGLITTSLFAVTISGTINTFVSGDILDSAKMNQNFASLKAAVESIDPQYSSAETLTHKRWIDGKQIYRKVIDVPNLPNNSTINIAHGLTFGSFAGQVSSVVSLSGVGTESTNGTIIPLPFYHTSGTGGIQMTMNGTNLTLIATPNFSNYTAKVILEYTRN